MSLTEHMTSESARMSSAAEARFRVQTPNSKPRATRVIALDAPSEAVVRGLAEAVSGSATFLTVIATADSAGGEPPADGWLIDLTGRRTLLQDELRGADLVIMIAAAGGDARGAAAIGRACSLARVTTTALVVGAAAASEQDQSKTLAQLRPWSLMVVIAGNDDYIADMMTALRV
jgi:hypothetical protein